MSYIDNKLVPADESRSPRQRRLIRGRMTDSFGVTYDIVIRNVSEKGVGATMQDIPPLRGSEVSITIPQGMEMNGTIRWVDGSAFGIELGQAIDLQTLTEVIQRKHQTINREAKWEVRKLHQVPTGHPDPSKVRKI
jgi:hypothetical protein